MLYLPSIDELEAEVSAGYIRKFYHNDFPDLVGYNYTEKCQFEKHWTTATMAARGLIWDKKKEYFVAIPFPKFFNWEEVNADERLPLSTCGSIYVKEDGSLIIAWWYEGAWRVSTRGSFHSEQAVMAQQILDKNSIFLENANRFHTFLFELVGPANKNVCFYSEDKLILLSAIDIVYHEESMQHMVDWYAQTFGFDRPKNLLTTELNFDTLVENIKNNTNPNFEGVVLQWGNYRLKLKTFVYCNLHKLITGEWTTNRLMDLWDTNREDFYDQLKDIPDEFFADIKDKLAEIDDQYIDYCLSTLHLLQQARFDRDEAAPFANEKEIRKHLAIYYPTLRPYLNLLMEYKDLYDCRKDYQKIMRKLFSNKMREEGC